MKAPPSEAPDLESIEEKALDHLAEQGAGSIDDFALIEDDEDLGVPRLRLSIAVAFATSAAAVMVGGVFIGWRAYVWSLVAGILGIGLAGYVQRLKRMTAVLISALFGIFAAGLVVVMASGEFGSVLNIAGLAREAADSGAVLRPPVEFTAGWRAITGWMMASIGFGAAWVALELRRGALALLIPLPIVGIGAISVPKAAQLGSGVAALALFALALGVLSGVTSDGEEQTPISHEIRRAARALPLIGATVVALVLLQKVNFLFPDTVYDPAKEAQTPKQVPPSEVVDRVIFTVESDITGPWRMGLLDVYDGKDWRLPPFAENKLKPVDESGIVDSSLVPELRATFEIKDLGGAVLPGMSNTAGIVAEGPKLAFDTRTGNIRLIQGQIEAGLVYTVVGARVPAIAELQRVQPPFPKEVQPFLSIPEAPEAVEALLRRAPTSSPWDTMDYMRQEFLKIVTAKGAGNPVSVTPSKVNDMLAGSKTGTPFEIVAGQAMLARWAGVPARIGYGYDGGDKVGGKLEVRPKHGAAFLEVFFTGYGWLPVLGSPQKAASSIGTAEKQLAKGIGASDEIAVPLVVAIQVDPRSYLFDQVRAVLAIVIPIILLLLLLYYSWPALHKAVRRSRTRTAAIREGPHARIANAYSEFRDVAADFGHLYPAETPLSFLSRVAEDEEHTELAWLVTRALWGDLKHEVGSQDVLIAEELSKALIKRMRQAHPSTLRVVAAVSRISLRSPHAKQLSSPTRRGRETQKAA